MTTKLCFLCGAELKDKANAIIHFSRRHPDWESTDRYKMFMDSFDEKEVKKEEKPQDKKEEVKEEVKVEEKSEKEKKTTKKQTKKSKKKNE